MKIDEVMQAIKSEMLARPHPTKCEGCVSCTVFQEMLRSPIARSVAVNIAREIVQTNTSEEFLYVLLQALALGYDIGQRVAQAEEMERTL